CLNAQRIVAAAARKTRECENVCDSQIDQLYEVDSLKVVELANGLGDGDDGSTGAEEDADTSEWVHTTFDLNHLASWLVGVVFGRFDPRVGTGERTIPPEPDPFAPPPSRSPGMYPEGEEPADRPDILVHDEG